jgi:hypothetical protein
MMSSEANGPARASDTAGGSAPSTLSVHLAFVVQFRESPGTS